MSKLTWNDAYNLKEKGYYCVLAHVDNALSLYCVSESLSSALDIAEEMTHKTYGAFFVAADPLWAKFAMLYPIGVPFQAIGPNGPFMAFSLGQEIDDRVVNKFSKMAQAGVNL